MARTDRPYPERGAVIGNPSLSWDRGLQLALVNLESLVSACHQRALNTSLVLVHTARRWRQIDKPEAADVCGLRGGVDEQPEVVTR